MKIFLDANVLVSVLNKEQPLFTYSSRILSLADSKKYQLYTTPICLAIAFYFSEKKSGTALANKKMNVLCSKLRIAEVNEKAVKETVLNKKIHDFEDGLQYYAALNKKCKYIITENIEDFYFSEIEILDCVSFFERVMMH